MIMASKIKIIFLGTAANIPTAKRNHTGILINYKDENILVDCGEGIQRQFRIGKVNPGKITKILLTHWHGDHIYGLLGLLSTLNSSEYKKNLIICGPRGIKKFLEGFFESARVQIGLKLEIKEVSGKFFDSEEFYLEAEKMEHGAPINAYNFVLKDKLRIDKKKLEKLKIPKGKHLSELQKGKDIKVDSRKIKAKDLTYLEKGKKISIVLDTANNPRIKPFVREADIFISETGLISEDKKIARERMHLLVEDVGKIAKSAKVKELILTHVSQRYEIRLNEVLNEAKKNFKKVRIVEDFDKIEI
jgi:ribonuclease Z